MEREKRQTNRTWTGSWFPVIVKGRLTGWQWVAEWDRAEASPEEVIKRALEEHSGHKVDVRPIKTETGTPPDPQGGG